MKKTLLITLEYPPQIGGVAHYYKNLVKHLSADKITVLDNQNNQLLSWPLWPKWLSSFRHVYKKIKKEKIEIILVGQILPLGTVALFFKKIFKLPYVVITHAMDVLLPQRYPRKKWLVKQILKNAQAITTVSNFTKKQLQKLIDPVQWHKIHLISPCPNVEASKINYELPKTGKIILSVGRLVKRKGFAKVIAILPELLKKFPDLSYYIIGEGEEKENLKRQAQGLPVTFLGFVPDEELSHYYQLADVFVMPALDLPYNVEGFGIVYIEANAFGKPVVAGKTGGVEDAIIDGQTGFLVDPRDQKMLAQAVERLLADEQLARKLGTNGFKRVKEQFQWTNQAKKLENLLS